MIRLLISLILLLSVYGGEWNAPITVAEKMVHNGVLYNEKATGITHVIWCDLEANYLYYAKIKNDKELVDKQSLRKMNACRRLFITGSSPKIFIGTTERVAYNSTYNKTKIIMFESKDSGNTWSSPIEIGGKNPELARKIVGMHLSKKMKRLWIFYTIFDILTGIKEFAFATKQVELGDYKSDINIGKGSNFGDAKTLYYKGRLHLVWGEMTEENKQVVKYSFSETLGLNWRAPTVIKEINLKEPRKFIAGLAVGSANVIFMGFNTGVDSKAVLVISKNNGDAWETTKDLSDNNGGFFTHLISCGPYEANNRRVYGFVNNMNEEKSVEFKSINAMDGTVVNKDIPDGGKGNYILKASCSTNNEEDGVRVLFNKNKNLIQYLKYSERLTN